jgi:V8-like Glu-specific endopeptidase
MASMRVGTPEQAMLQKQAQQNLHARLMTQQVELGIKNSIVVDLNDDQRKSLVSKSQWPLRVGVLAPVAVDITFDIGSPKAVTGDAMILPYGAVRRVGKEMVWTTVVKSYNANGIRLFITGLDLPKGVELAIYNQRGEAFAYTGKGPFANGELWTNAVTGGAAYLQLTGADLSRVSFTIAELGYLGDNWVLGAHSTVEKSHCSYNEWCVENAGCGIDQPVQDATNAVGMMLYVKRPYMYTCSGGLIANDAGKTYFLTANHCISRDREAGTLETYFFYEIGCNDPCPAAWSEPNTPRVLGSTVAATNRTSDYTILELGGAAPAGTVMLGWNTTDIAFSSEPLFRISHPATAPQAYSKHVVDTSYGVCSSWPRGAWIYSRDIYGATEGGSSGSPVVNDAGEIVGQLSGGCGTNINETCDWESNATVDGSFAAYYNEVAGLLGGGGCVVTEDPEVSCSDGVDNDCDGLTDAADPDCGGGECLLKGEVCTTNEECCSLLCHPVKGTCK